MAGATHAVGNASGVFRVKNCLRAAANAVPSMSRDYAHYEPVAWWFTRNRIGRDLREQYKVPAELPSELRALIGKLEIEGCELFREFQRRDSRNTIDSAISTQDLVLASERSIAELDAPAPPER